MKAKMIATTVFLCMAFAVSLPVFLVTESALAETVTISIGVTLYHFAMRLAVGTAVKTVMKNRADHRSTWFREKDFEHGLYQHLGVRRWKKHLPTYDPQTFDTKQKTVAEMIGASCQAEVVHEIIMLLSLLPIAFIPLLGGAAAMIITSVFSMLYDALFVILQRYNRPKLVRVMGRFQKLK